MIECKNCAKQFLCDKKSCDYKSFIQAKNYGETKYCFGNYKLFTKCEVEKRGCNGCYYYTK